LFFAPIGKIFSFICSDREIFHFFYPIGKNFQFFALLLIDFINDLIKSSKPGKTGQNSKTGQKPGKIFKTGHLPGNRVILVSLPGDEILIGAGAGPDLKFKSGHRSRSFWATPGRIRSRIFQNIDFITDF
jgi:hypothetical protein